MLISVELLSEVMGLDDVAGFSIDGDSELIIYDSFEVKDKVCGLPINIHELVHKCKQWAVSKGYTLVESPLMLRITKLCTNQNKIWEYTLEEQNTGEYFKPEYTFKACEWIMKQSKRHHE